MSFLRRMFARLAGMFTKHRADADLREEMEAHLAMDTAENIRRGMHPDEARRQALIAAGGLTQAAEAVRDQRGVPLIENAVADVRYAWRALRRNPGFTAVVVITLGLGIGANTAIFSVMRGVLLKPLPHRDGDRLVYLRHSVDGPGRGNIEFSVPEVGDFRSGAPALADIAEYSPFFFNLHDDEGTIRIDVGLVTGNYFAIMGLAPIHGRLTRPSDDGTGVPPVMVLTHEFWQRRFGGDPAVVGRQLRLGSKSATVIGVLQPAPSFPDKVDAFVNMVISDHHLSALMVTDRSHRMTEVVARLGPGATVGQARTEVAAVFARMQSQHPEAYQATDHHRVAVLPFKEVLGEKARLTLWLLMAAAAFVLVISAANVANLTLMRGVRREHELVVRAALGAGVARLRRLLLTENLMLALMGAAVGLLIALFGIGLLVSFAERYSPRANEIRLDAWVLGFALALSALVALLLSFVATLPREGTFAAWIAAGGQRISGNFRGQLLQRGLVVAQVAVSVVLLAGAGLLTRTMVQLSEVETGLVTEDVLSVPVSLFDPTRFDFASDGATKQTYERMRREMLALPGVIDVGLGSTMPLRTSFLTFDVAVLGKAFAPGEAPPHADVRTASPEYLRAAGIPLRRGRDFAATDAPGAGRVVIINQTLADRLFPGEDPLGKQLAFRSPILRLTPISGDWRTIVGVAGNTQDGGLDAQPRAVVYLPFAQELTIFGGLVVRASSDAPDLAGSVARIVRRLAPQAPAEPVLTVAQIKDESVAPRRLNAALIASFGILAVLIAAVGIAGVLAFSVSARTVEIGIRMSLGASGGRVLRMVLGEGGVLLAIGLALGVAGAYLGAGVMRGLLFGVAPHDPATFIGVALMMAAIGTLACWIPALRAARIDPAITMRAA